MAYRGGSIRVHCGGWGRDQNEIKGDAAIRAGGFIRGGDHGVADDVSWPNFGVLHRSCWRRRRAGCEGRGAWVSGECGPRADKCEWCE